MLDFHLYHCLMKCIIHQQLNLSFAYELTKRFVHTYGEQIEGVWFDPLPETIASLETDDLRKLQFSQRKAEYVIDVSKRIVSGSLCLEELHDLSDLEVEERLLPIRGIGPWTVQNVLMNGLGRPNLFRWQISAFKTQSNVTLTCLKTDKRRDGSAKQGMDPIFKLRFFIFMEKH